MLIIKTSVLIMCRLLMNAHFFIPNYDNVEPMIWVHTNLYNINYCIYAVKHNSFAYKSCKYRFYSLRLVIHQSNNNTISHFVLYKLILIRTGSLHNYIVLLNDLWIILLLLLEVCFTKYLEYHKFQYCISLFTFFTHQMFYHH